MKATEYNADKLLNELKNLVDELKIAVGREERLVLGMRVKRVDYHQVASLLPAIERLLERYHTVSEEGDQWQTLVASYDAESQRILNVYAPGVDR